MITHYLNIAFRTLRTRAVYSLVNLLGLALGMACVILTMRYAQYERSYDTAPARAERTYRVEQHVLDRHGAPQRTALTPGPLADALRQDVPDVEQTVRLFTYAWKETARVAYGDARFYEPRFFLADPGIFDVFDLSFLRGDPATAFAEPDAVVITEAVAHRYFGEDDPIGRRLRITLYETYDFKVTGVMRGFPPNAHVHADLIAPLSAGPVLFWDDFGANWHSRDFYTYVVLAEGASPRAVTAAAQRIVERRPNDPGGALALQPVRRIHLGSHLPDEIETNGDPAALYFFSILAFAILGIACLNFVTLALARSTTRVREIGIRKVAGAHRLHLAAQFLGESVVLALLALPPALALAEVCLPVFQVVVGQSQPFGGAPLLPGALPAGLGIALGTGLLAGLYPALVLSAIRPSLILKGLVVGSFRNSRLRRTLLVVQFATAIVFVSGTLVVARQVRFIRQTAPGFGEQSVVVLPFRDDDVRQRYEQLAAALRTQSPVTHVAATSLLPGTMQRSVSDAVAAGSDTPLLVRLMAVSHDFTEALGLDLVAGRGFSEAVATDATGALLVNEAAVRAFGWDEPLGQVLTLDRDAVVPVRGTVVGVLRDAPFASLRQAVEPLVLHVGPDRYAYAVVQLRTDRLAAGLDALRTTWRQVNPDQPFDYQFLDAHMEAAYARDVRTGRLLRYAGILALAIACMGLFGMAAFTAEQRTKEIGIRKVLGATVASLVLLLSRDVVRLVLLALLLAAPIAYLVMDRWLDQFAFRIDIRGSECLLAGLIALGVTLLTVGYQAVRAAQADPVKSLRYE